MTLRNYFHESPAIDGVYPVAGYDNSYNLYTPDDLYAQNFIPAASYAIGSVKLPLARVGSPGIVGVSIYAVDGSFKPTGAALAAGTTNGDTLTDDYGWTWRTITLSTNPTLSAGTEYAMVVSCAESDEENYAYWWFDDGTTPIASPPAAQRRSFRSQNGGSTWLLLSTLTCTNFEIYDNYTFTPPSAGPTKKRLIAAAYNKIWYESTP
jgi:hypothetical protein